MQFLSNLLFQALLFLNITKKENVDHLKKYIEKSDFKNFEKFIKSKKINKQEYIKFAEKKLDYCKARVDAGEPTAQDIYNTLIGLGVWGINAFNFYKLFCDEEYHLEEVFWMELPDPENKLDFQKFIKIAKHEYVTLTISAISLLCGSRLIKRGICKENSFDKYKNAIAIKNSLMGQENDK